MELSKRQPVASQSTPDMSAHQEVQRTLGKAASAMGAVAKIGEQTVKLGLEYRDKNKKSDMMADKLNFSTFKKQVLTTAAEQSAKTTDKKSIDRIYREAERRIDEWAGASTDGIPNVRWKDQVPMIKGEAQNFRAILEGERVERNLTVSRANTKAIAERTMTDAILDNDEVAMRGAVAVMVEAGMMTPEEGTTWRTESMRKAQLNEGENLVALIETKSPDEAEQLANFMKEEVDNYTELNEEERILLKTSMDSAVATAQKRQQAAEAQQEKVRQETHYSASTDLLSGFYSGEIPYESMMTIAKEFGELDTYLETQKIAWSQSPEKQQKRMQSQAYQDIRKDIHLWDKSVDKDGKQLRTMMYEIGKFGDAGVPMMTELYLVATGQKIGEVDGNSMKMLNQQIELAIDGAVAAYDGDIPLAWQEGIRLGGPKGEPIMASGMELLIKNHLITLIKSQKLDTQQALDLLDEHPMFVDLKNANLIRFQNNWDAFSRTGRWVDEEVMERTFQ